MKGVTGPTAKPCRLSSRGTMASFQLHEGSKRVCVSFTCASGFPSKGNAGPQVERISHIIPLYSLVGKTVGKTAEHIFPAVWMHLGNTSWDQDCEGHCGTPSWYCRVASCAPGPLTPSISYRWSVGWITTYFWSYDLEFLSLQTLKCISCEPSYCFFSIWNEIQVPLSKVLPLNFDNAYPLKYVMSWK